MKKLSPRYTKSDTLFPLYFKYHPKLFSPFYLAINIHENSNAIPSFLKAFCYLKTTLLPHICTFYLNCLKSLKPNKKSQPHKMPLYFSRSNIHLRNQKTNLHLYFINTIYFIRLNHLPKYSNHPLIFPNQNKISKLHCFILSPSLIKWSSKE